MLAHPTIEQLHAMGLKGMAKALVELSDNEDARTLSHAEWLGLLLEREATLRHDRRLAARLRWLSPFGWCKFLMERPGRADRKRLRAPWARGRSSENLGKGRVAKRNPD